MTLFKRELAPLIAANLLETAVFHPNHGLFLLLSTPVNWTAVRHAWRETSSETPILAAPAPIISSFLQLHPQFSQDLKSKKSVLCYGKMPAIVSQNLTPHAYLSHICLQAMQASQALTPSLLDEKVANRQTEQLAKLSGTRSETPIAQFCTLQNMLQGELLKLAPHPALTESTAANYSTPPPTLPTLRAIYRRELGQTIFVFDPLNADVLSGLNWQALTEDLENRGAGLEITTPKQLRLVAAFQQPLDLTLRRIRHEWGVDFLAGLVADETAAFRHAAQLPAQIYVQQFAPAFLNASNDLDNELIHDYQNKLFNVRLTGELLTRTIDQAPITPPALPDRTAPTVERLSAIFDQLQWWLDYFFSQTNQ